MRQPERRTKEVINHPTPNPTVQQGAYMAPSSQQEIDDLAPVHWINPTTERYYAARLILNLIGQWELQQAWAACIVGAVGFAIGPWLAAPMASTIWPFWRAGARNAAI